MAFSTIGVAKQNGSSVGSSSLHNDRGRETPNADPERTHLNRVLIGDERSAGERVRQIIAEHGGKPRRDSVEAIELLLSATHFLDGRKRMKELHTRYNSYVKDLGLERGREGSRATHQRVKQFYASVTKNPELKIDPEQIPDPSRLKLMTADGARQYKLEILAHVLEQLQEPIRVLQDQAKLTKDEHAHRVEAEKRADAAELAAAERVEAAERQAEERIAEGLRLTEGRFQNLLRSAQFLMDENKELRGDRGDLLRQRNVLQEKLLKEGQEKLTHMARARELGERLTDIPLVNVMDHFGYRGEQDGQTYLYRGANDVVAMSIERQMAFDCNNQLICRNSVDLVVHMKEFNKGVEGFSRDDAVEWLGKEFGERGRRRR
jgi:hypothetical protein